MNEHRPMETLDELLEQEEHLARSLIHKLQAGACVDAHLGGEFSYLEMNLDLWRRFFTLLGYTLKQSELGGETFYFLEARSTSVSTVRLSRGATFLGLYLAWHFLSQGMESMDKIGARNVMDALRSSFDFNMLMTVFNPKSKGKMRKRQESRKQHENLQSWMRSCLNELHRQRSIELGPNMRAGWEELTIYRLPGLQRFWDLARDALVLDQSPEEVDLAATVTRVWERVEPEEDANGSEDDAHAQT